MATTGSWRACRAARRWRVGDACCAGGELRLVRQSQDDDLNDAKLANVVLMIRLRSAAFLTEGGLHHLTTAHRVSRPDSDTAVPSDSQELLSAGKRCCRFQKLRLQTSELPCRVPNHMLTWAWQSLAPRRHAGEPATARSYPSGSRYKYARHPSFIMARKI